MYIYLNMYIFKYIYIVVKDYVYIYVYIYIYLSNFKQFHFFSMTYTNRCIYTVVPTDNEQQACSKHVEVNY